MNGIFTLLYRGQWNDEFVTAVGKDTDLVTRLSAFTQKQWMIGSDAQYLIVNAASELARLKQYSDTPIQSAVDTGLNAIFQRILALVMVMRFGLRQLTRLVITQIVMIMVFVGL